jgi:uncharacterized protein YkwD
MRTVSAPVRRCCVLAGLGVVLLLAVVSIRAGSAHARASVARTRCANAGRAARRLSLQAVRAAVVCLINQQRTERGLPPLTVAPQLDDSAQQWTVEMVQTGNFGHGDPFGRMSAAGYEWQAAGENIATGQQTPRAVVAGWMASVTHCRTILNPDFRNVGTGETPSPVRGWAQKPATWTQDFGLLIGARAPSHNAAAANACPV